MTVLLDILTAFWLVLAQMAPYLLFGFFMAGLLSTLISPETVERHLGGRGFLPIFKAALFGVPLPLCSCGVIPVAASLRRHGASRGATVAFLISTPATGVDSILVTYSLLGPVFAVFRPLWELVSGVIGGVLVMSGVRQDDAVDGPAVECTGECCNPGGSVGNRFVRALRYGFATLPRDIGRALLVGLAVAALISALVPDNFFADAVGRGWVQVLLLMVVGIPVYVCATASVPVAAALILHAGVSPGAALAFLITGPATNAATVAAVWKTMGRRTAVIYLLTIAITAFGAGTLLDWIFDVTQIDPRASMQRAEHVHAASSWEFWLNNVSAVALLGILAAAVFRPTLGRISGPVEPDACKDHDHVRETLTLTVGGMTCSHCVDAVGRTLREQPGVHSARVDLKTGLAVATGKDLDADALCRAVRQLGYEASVHKDTG
jgi:uncharacterized membrane protein YraQ (UPF0718 family)/copper chaperone CopZ